MNPEFKFKTNFIVRVGDINYGGHMGNDKYLLVLHDARIRFLESLGFSETDIGDEKSDIAGLIMSEARIKYKAEAFIGDELVTGVRITEMKGITFNFEYEIERVSDNKTIATGVTRMAVFDYAKRRVRKIPVEFEKRIKAAFT